MSNDERIDNVYVIDTKMFGFTGWCSAFLVAGKELALIDTGPPTSAQFVRNGIKDYGFALEDISYVFITHHHFDHCGSAGILLQEMPETKVLVHPRVAKHLIDPSIMNENIKRDTGSKMASRFGELLPIPSSRVQPLNDGDTIDLGDNEKLKVIFTPGHAFSEIAIYDEKNKGLFIGDAPGIYFAEEDVLLAITPPGTDIKLAVETLKMLVSIPASKYFLGHYGICNTPGDLVSRALDALKLRFDIASEAMEQNVPEEIPKKIIDSISSELDKLKLREEGLYEYLTEELIPVWARGIVGYLKRLR